MEMAAKASNMVLGDTRPQCGQGRGVTGLVEHDHVQVPFHKVNGSFLPFFPQTLGKKLKSEKKAALGE
jgi:hypothetical protein